MWQFAQLFHENLDIIHGTPPRPLPIEPHLAQDGVHFGLRVRHFRLQFAERPCIASGERREGRGEPAQRRLEDRHDGGLEGGTPLAVEEQGLHVLLRQFGELGFRLVVQPLPQRAFGGTGVRLFLLEFKIPPCRFACLAKFLQFLLRADAPSVITKTSPIENSTFNRTGFLLSLAVLQKEELPMVERIAGSKIKSLWTQYPIVTLIGPRQSGKTTLARALFPEADYVNLEAPDVLDEAVHDARAFLSRHPAPVIFDEVQRCPELLRYLQVVVDAAGRDGMYLLTGSHQPALLGAVSQSLAGRTALVDLYPLSIQELKRTGMKKTRDAWMLEGFLPRLYDSRRERPDTAQFYRDYFRTYVERDVRQLANLRDAGLFETFIKLLAGRVGQEVNALDIAGAVGVSAPTIRSWIALLEASFIVFVLRPYYRNFGKRLVKAPKVYFTEPGLVAWLLGIRTEEQMATHPLAGSLFENMVVMEAVKARCNAAEDVNLHFYRASNGLEVDLLQEDGLRIRPIEIKSAQTYHSSMGRNLLRFEGFAENVERPTVVYAGRSVPSETGVSVYSFEDDWMS